MGSQGSKPGAACPACAGSTLRSLGTPRVVDAGGLRSQAVEVCRCLTCDLLFFAPVSQGQVLADHYAALADERWSSNTRPDWKLARQAILDRLSSGTVLDVGCWTGEFLATLPPSFERCGVEPSEWARCQAIDKGVSVVGSAMEELVESDATFEVVTMIDVVEHFASPLEALVLGAGRLKERGFLVISTGNSRALPWRLMPTDYWYYNAEHVCFVSERWFAWATAHADLQMDQVRHFSHYPATWPGEPFAELAKACVVRVLRMPRPLAVQRALGARIEGRHVSTKHWSDHILVVLQKRASG